MRALRRTGVLGSEICIGHVSGLHRRLLGMLGLINYHILAILCRFSLDLLGRSCSYECRKSSEN